MTLQFFIRETKCYGKHSSRAVECKSCVLVSFCSAFKAEQKAEAQEAKAQEVVAQEVVAQVAETVGVDASSITVPDGVVLSKGRRFAAKQAVKCTASGKEIKAGEFMVFVPSWGIISDDVAQALGFAG